MTNQPGPLILLLGPQPQDEMRIRFTVGEGAPLTPETQESTDLVLSQGLANTKAVVGTAHAINAISNPASALVLPINAHPRSVSDADALDRNPQLRNYFE